MYTEQTLTLLSHCCSGDRIHLDYILKSIKILNACSVSDVQISCRETLPDADFPLYPLQMKSGNSLNELQQKEKKPVLTLTFIVLPVSLSVHH